MNYAQSLLEALRRRIRIWLLVERDLQAHQFGRQSDLLQIEDAIRGNSTLLDQFKATHTGRYVGLAAQVVQMDERLKALEKRLKYYGDHNDSLAFTARKYDRLLKAESEAAAVQKS